MPALRLPLRLVLPTGLILLVIVLGALQYRWLGQVSEAERAQLQRSLNQRAQEFATDFDKEIGLAYALLGATHTTADDGLWTSMDTRFDSWKKQAPHPGLVKAIYFCRVGVAEKPPVLEQLVVGSGEGRVLDWPDHLAPVLRVFHLVPARPASPPVTARLLSISRASVVESVPALIIPVVQPPQRISAAGNVMMAIQQPSTGAIIVELDKDVLVTRILPELVERHFPDGDAGQYHIAVRGSSPTPLYVRSTTPSEAVTMMNADAMASFFSSPHLDLTAQSRGAAALSTWQFTTATFDRRAGAVTEMATRILAPTPGNLAIVVGRTMSGTRLVEPSVISTFGGWHIALRHGAGSLDAAVAKARQRNLIVSFSILSVLALGVGLIVVNARRSEKLASQQMDFVATVSHELRTPLAVIRSAAQNLAAGVVDDPVRAKRYGELIESEGRRLTDMVEEVLEFAGLSGQRRALALKAVDVVSMVQDVVESSSALIAAAQAQADVTIGPDVPLVMGDEDALRRAVSNLLTNALKHGGEGHWVGINVGRQAANGREEVHIVVSDRGRGIEDADLPHVFEPFYRGRHATSQQIQGNGLGLSLVSRIAESHGGRVTVASVPKQGATFTIQLPVAADLAGV